MIMLYKNQFARAQLKQNLRVTFRLLISFSLALTLSSCAVYSAGFNCSGGRGAKCVMLSDIDQKISSGEIETVYSDKKCKSGRCKEAKDTPEQQLGTHQTKIELLNPEADQWEVFTDAD